MKNKIFLFKKITRKALKNQYFPGYRYKSKRPDSNGRPLRPERSALPN